MATAVGVGPVPGVAARRKGPAQSAPVVSPAPVVTRGEQTAPKSMILVQNVRPAFTPECNAVISSKNISFVSTAPGIHGLPAPVQVMISTNTPVWEVAVSVSDLIGERDGARVPPSHVLLSVGDTPVRARQNGADRAFGQGAVVWQGAGEGDQIVYVDIRLKITLAMQAGNYRGTINVECHAASGG